MSNLNTQRVLSTRTVGGLYAMWVVALLSLLTSGDLFFAQAKDKPSTLTAEDYVQIQQLYATYALALDTGYGPGRVALFVSGGTISSDASNHKPETIEVVVKRASGRGLTGVRHYVSNIAITETANGANGSSYAIVSDGKKTSSGGVEGALASYKDTLVRTDKGWRFKTREVWLNRSYPSGPGRAGDNEQLERAPDKAKAEAPSVKSNDESADDDLSAPQYYFKFFTQQSDSAVKLTPKDYFEILQLFSNYSFGLDTQSGPARVAVFTPDAIFTSNVAKHVPETMADMARRMPATPRKEFPIGGHMMFDIAIVPSADGAKSMSEALIGSSANDKGEIQGTRSFYLDTLVKTPDGWRFRTRQVFSGDGAYLPFNSTLPVEPAPALTDN